MYTHNQYIFTFIFLFSMGELHTQLRASEIEPLQEVVVSTVDGQVHTGQLISLSDTQGIKLQIGLDKYLQSSTADMINISTSFNQNSPRQKDAFIKISNFDHMYGQLVDQGEDVVILETADLGKVSVPLDRVLEIIPGGQNKLSRQRTETWLRRNLPSSEDVVLLANGDTMRGFLVSVSEQIFIFESGGKDWQLPMANVRAVKLSTERESKPTHPHFTMRLRNSGQVTADRLQWEKNIINAHLQFGANAQIEAECVASFEIEGGRWQWLSQLSPISYEHTPMMSLHWHYTTDTNIVGDQMRVSLESYEHGIGVHSRSVLKYDLKGSYQEFVTSFGIDDDSGPLADVHVLIVVDGARKFEKENVRQGTLHGPLRINVQNAKTLELVVDFGLHGDIQDRFNWIEAALIR